MPDLPCHDNAETFFADSPAVLEHARTLCAACPVLDLCLAGAVERREPHGVWGGQIFIGGVIVERKRPRGRPRKAA